jgi:PIN domain nuclease of toxin-antitoxin system
VLSMVVCDTHILIFDALVPDRLTPAAQRAFTAGAESRELACCDITLWEIAMLIAKKRVDPGTNAIQFIEDIMLSRHLKVLPITAAIAVLSQTHPDLSHGDPADRLIAATALHYNASLITSDERLRNIDNLSTIW